MLQDTEDLYKENSQNLGNVERCLKHLSKVAFTLSSYNGPCFGEPPKGAKARISQRHLLNAGKAGAGAAANPAAVPSTSEAEIARLRGDLQQKEHELEAQARQIQSLKSQLEQQQKQSMGGLELDLSETDDFERLIMSEPGETPRLDRDVPKVGKAEILAPVIGGCAKCARLEAALTAAEAALNEVYSAYAEPESGEGRDTNSTFESLVKDVSRLAGGRVASG